MKIAYIIFDGITWLDFIGVYDPISRLKSMKYLPDLSWDICSFTNIVTDNFGLEIRPNKIQNILADYDTVIIPGGHGTRELQYNTDFLNWIKTSGKARYKISICTGSVDDNDIITAGAVSASLDLGLYLCKKWAGPEAQIEIRKRMDYHG
jgi:putative intracellular protease/amidase